ncbi:hypothetical protein ACLBKT_09400 [Erythrobacter sp. W302b]|uniref:hypothetical protein n=1 Tax=Erythrobacter sp. W302b TaxID=3389874 RepID=UPI00396B1523
MRVLGRKLVLLLSIPFATLATSATADDPSPTLYVYVTRAKPVVLRDGGFGPIAALQLRMKELLRPIDPGISDALIADGQFGPKSGHALQRLLATAEYSAFAPRKGQPLRISEALWRKLMPGVAPPSREERSMTLILTYEATEFNKIASWNFCQNPKLGTDGKKVTRRPECRTNDDSLLTWGPRGATMMGGSEIQAVIIELRQRAPHLLHSAFGVEYAALDRSLALSKSPSIEPEKGKVRTLANVSDLELYMCSIWLDPARASTWSQAFAQLGSSAMVRSVYNEIYASAGFDGSKVRGFYTLYEKLGVAPSEIDHAFFLDRATHTSGVTSDISGVSANSVGAALRRAEQIMAKLGSPPYANWQVRQAISQILIPTRQRADRNGRDVAFFVDALGEDGLTATERANWRERFALSASMFGLSDDRPMPRSFVPDPTSWKTRLVPSQSLTPDERQTLCPQWVIERTVI